MDEGVSRFEERFATQFMVFFQLKMHFAPNLKDQLLIQLELTLVLVIFIIIRFAFLGIVAFHETVVIDSHLAATDIIAFLPVCGLLNEFHRHIIFLLLSFDLYLIRSPYRLSLHAFLVQRDHKHSDLIVNLDLFDVGVVLYEGLLLIHGYVIIFLECLVGSE